MHLKDREITVLGAGVADAEPQPEEFPVIAHLGDDVFEAIVAPMTPALFELGDAGGQIQFVVGNQHLFGRYLVEAGQGSHCLAGEIHIGVGDEQPHILSLDQDAGDVTMELGLFTQAGVVPAGQLLHIPGARIVAGLGILGARITQTDDQFDLACHAQSLHSQQPEAECLGQ